VFPPPTVRSNDNIASYRRTRKGVSIVKIPVRWVAIEFCKGDGAGGGSGRTTLDVIRAHNEIVEPGADGTGLRASTWPKLRAFYNVI